MIDPTLLDQGPLIIAMTGMGICVLAIIVSGLLGIILTSSENDLTRLCGWALTAAVVPLILALPTWTNAASIQREYLEQNRLEATAAVIKAIKTEYDNVIWVSLKENQQAWKCDDLLALQAGEPRPIKIGLWDRLGSYEAMLTIENDRPVLSTQEGLSASSLQRNQN